MRKAALLILSCLLLFPAFAQADSSAVKSKQNKNIGITGIPTISFDRSRGMGFGGMGMMFFELGNKPGTPPSRVSVSAQYTTKHNWMAMGFVQLFLWEDFLRLSTGGGYFSSHFQTYVNVAGDGNMEIPYGNSGFFIFLSPLFKLYPHLYVGPTVGMFDSNIDSGNPDYLPDQVNKSNSIGLVALYDTKDNQYNPAKGITANIRYTNNPSWLGNNETFNKIFLYANYYVRLDKSKILASRISGNVGLGTVPFSSQSYVGGEDIRGYTKGEYRGNQTYALQSELRWAIYKRWGAVGFAGVAMTVNPNSQLLPGAGLGIRYKILKKYNINAGLDGALGKDDWGIYFRITEAF